MKCLSLELEEKLSLFENIESSQTQKKFRYDIVGRGRQDFSQIGIVRSKPGRGDAINTQSMSCR